jgi:1-deoxyxylulose-5-phosphate synthase
VRYTYLGTTGIAVSRIALGTSLFGVAPDADGAREMIAAADDLGVNVIDTADAYGNLPHFDRPGVPPAAERESAEEIIGRALGARREKFVLSTKAMEPVGPDVNDRGLSRRHLYDALDRSLRRLRTDHVDLFYAHHPDPSTPLESTVATMDQLVRAGKVRHWALSTYPAWQTVQALWIADDRRLEPPVALQVRYHLLARGAETEIVPAAHRFGLSLMVFSPLGGGLLAGRSAADRHFAGETRWGGAAFTPSQLAAAERLDTVAAAAGRPAAQLALAWLLGRPGVASAIVGPESVADLEAAAGAVDLELTDDVRAALDALADPPVTEPAPRPRRPAVATPHP